MRSIKKLRFVLSIGLIIATGSHPIVSQTLIKAGNISGIWSKRSSPYLICGDVNIPAGKTLIIQSGVTVKFTGPFTVNIQGSLLAAGAEKDSIIFTLADTTGIRQGKRSGWNGLHFDRRPIEWDTLVFRMPEEEGFRKLVEQRIKNKTLDTTTRIYLVMKVPDVVNDTLLPDSVFSTKQGSRLSYCRFEFATSEGKAQPYVFGGAIYIYRYSNLLIKNCKFEHDMAWAGGAIYCKEAAPIIMQNRFEKCSANSSGGAMVFVHSGPILMDNIVSENVSGFNGGAALFYESSPYALNNTFNANKAENSGGAVFIEQKMNLFSDSSTYCPVAGIKFPRNSSFDRENLNTTSPSNTNSYYGRFINNIISNNSALTGGGISVFATMPDFISLTLCDNRADSAGGGLYCNTADPRIINSILYGNFKEQVYLSGESRPSFQYCTIESGTSGVRKDSSNKGSIDYTEISNKAPEFQKPGSGNYSLTEGSGCIDAGIPDTSSLKLPPVDHSGKSRIINNRIDIGALEYAVDKKNLKSTDNPDNVDPDVSDLAAEMYTCIFPNPNPGSFSIVIHNNKFKVLTIRIVAQSGQEVFNNRFQADVCFETQINLTGYAQGIYIVTINSEDEIVYNSNIILQ